MEHKEINRGWVKNAAIIFLAVLLVLTFFSNTIMNRTLPEAAGIGDAFCRCKRQLSGQGRPDA